MLFLSRPALGRITQQFTATHRALDFGWGLGKTVRAAAAGKVRLQADPYYGLRIFLEHDADNETEYSHLAGRFVKDGEWVKRRQKIARMGNSGSFAEFVHLHFAHWFKGVRIKPVFGKKPTLPAGKPGKPTIEPSEDSMLFFKTKDNYYVAGVNDVEKITRAEAIALGKGGGDYQVVSSDEAKLIIDGCQRRELRRLKRQAAAVGVADVAGRLESVVAEFEKLKLEEGGFSEADAAAERQAVAIAVADEIDGRSRARLKV